MLAIKRLLPTTICILVLTGTACMPSLNSEEDQQPADLPRDLVWVVVDTLRADYVGCYGGATNTPNIDSLASRGIRFSNAYSHIPVTGPSHVSMFSGLLPSDHQVEANASIVPEQIEMLAERLKGEGFSTAGVVSLGVLRKKFGFHQGFDSWNDTFDTEWFRRADEITDASLESASHLTGNRRFLFVHYSDPHAPYSPPTLEYPNISLIIRGTEIDRVVADGSGRTLPIKLPPGDSVIEIKSTDSTADSLVFQEIRITNTKVDAFCGQGWVSPEGEPFGRRSVATLPATIRINNRTGKTGTFDLRFMVEERTSVKETRRRYGLEVEYVDSEIGRLFEGLERLGFTQDSLIVITSDHGESLGEHAHFGHIHQLYQPLIAVPLIMIADGLAMGTVDNRVVGHTDLLPTVSRILGLQNEINACRGEDLFGPGSAAQDIQKRTHVAMTYRPLARNNLRALVTDRHSLIVNLDNDRRELYAVRNDPRESDNLLLNPSPENQSIADSMLAILGEIEGSPIRVTGAEVLDAELSDMEKSQLEALGYIQ